MMDNKQPGWSLPAKIAVIFAILIGIAYFISGNRDSEPTQPADQPSKETLLQPIKEPQTPWTYTSLIDKMRGTLTQYAIVDSTNKLYFDFPYEGGSSAMLKLRKSPQFGKDVILRIEKGQFLCYSYDGCSVAMKFDNDKVEDYLAYEPDDGSSDVLFLHPYEKIVNKLRGSKHLTIEAKFYNQGRRQIEFDVSGLVWKEQSEPHKVIRARAEPKSAPVTEEPTVELKDKTSIEEIQKEYEREEKEQIDRRKSVN